MFNPLTDATMGYREAQDLVLKAAEMANSLTPNEHEILPFAIATLIVRNNIFARQVDAPNTNV